MRIFGKRSRVIITGILLILIIVLVAVFVPPSNQISSTSSSRTSTTTARSTLTTTDSSSESQLCLASCSSTSTTTFTTSTTTTTSATTTEKHDITGRRLGFWLQESDPIRGYTPQQFFDQYFLTPPYPSTLELMVFATMDSGISLSDSINYWGQVASLADKYVNIEITPMLAFGTNNSSPSLQYWSNVQQWINALKVHPSIYSFGIEGEYSTQLNASDIPMIANYIHETGKQFINYYLHSSAYIVMGESGGFQIGHTNFPDYYAGNGDQVPTLSYFTDQYSVGISAGVYFPAQFPGKMTCPIAVDGINSTSYGYNQCVVDTLISSDLSLPPAVRQFVNLVPGLSYPKFSTFTDSAGIDTAQMWDNQMLRTWIWDDSNYTSNFLLSNYQNY